MSVLLICGENEYAAMEFYKKTLADFVGNNSSQSLRRIDGENATAAEVETALASQSLFGVGKEMIAIKRLGANSELKDKLVELVATIPENTELIIYEPRIDKRSKLYKKLKSSKLFKEFTALSDGQLIAWINERVREKGGKMEHGSAKLLIDFTKGDQLRLINELDKLLGYGSTITTETVKLLVEKSPDDNIFELLNFVSKNDTKNALNKYNELKLARVEAHYILVMMCWQMTNFLSVKAAKGKSDSEVSKNLGMNPRVVGRTRQLVSSIEQTKLRTMATKILATDTKLKTTSVDGDQLVKQLIAKL